MLLRETNPLILPSAIIQDDLQSEQLKMADLLVKFRIDFSDVIMIPDVQKPPLEESSKQFNKLIEQFMISEEDEDETQCKLPQG